MFHPSKKMLYAIEAVLDIAYHAGSGPVRSGDITRRQGIPRRYLEQTLQHLVKSGVLVGVRGPRGGYRLARERRRVSLGEVVRVVAALESGEEAPEEQPASELGVRVIRPLWDDLQAELMGRLDTITIDDLCLRAYRSGVPSMVAETMDFSI